MKYEKVFRPKFFHLFQKGRYSKDRFVSDLIAGVITGIIAFGIANIVTPLFEGIPATGALARTMASINNGAKTSVAGIVHSVVLMLITFLLTVVVDLTVAIEVGVLLAIVLFVRRMMQTSSIEVLDQAKLAATEDDEKANFEDTEHLDVHKGVEVYEINGPYFFGLAAQSEEFETRKNAELGRDNIYDHIIPALAAANSIADAGRQ